MTDFMERQLAQTQQFAALDRYERLSSLTIQSEVVVLDVPEVKFFDWEDECLEFVDEDQRVSLAARLCVRADRIGDTNYPTDAWKVVAKVADEEGITPDQAITKYGL